MTATHTPGPWHVIIGRMNADAPAFGFGIFPDRPTLDNLPADVRQHSLASGNLYEHSAFGAFYPPEVIEANARLIAAAPELLAVAVRMVADADSFAQSFGLERINEAHDSLIADARVAIAKAEGS